MKKVIAIGDLGHVEKMLSNNFVPINIGFMGSYITKQFSNDTSVSFFKDPENLYNFIEKHRPDVLALSNYVWNERLTFHFANVAKRMQPNTLVVVGGPNIPIDEKREIEFLNNCKDTLVKKIITILEAVLDTTKAAF